MREARTVSRDISGALVPYGTPHELKAGETIYLTQSLGGSHTCVTEMGQMVRIDAQDADAVGEQVAAAPSADDVRDRPLDQVVWERLKTCYDPEIPVNIVDLGLVYSVKVDEVGPEDGFAAGNKVTVRFALTAPGCGMGDVLKQDIVRKVNELPTVVQSDVDVTFDPPWTQELMSDAARLQLGLM